MNFVAQNHAMDRIPPTIVKVRFINFFWNNLSNMIFLFIIR